MRSDRKPTLRERAQDAVDTWADAGKLHRDLWLSGHRADRLTKAERAELASARELVAALERDKDLLEFHEADGILDAMEIHRRAVSNLERARKGGK